MVDNLVELSIINGGRIRPKIMGHESVPETNYLLGKTAAGDYHFFREYQGIQLPSGISLRESKGAVILPKGKKTLNDLVWGDVLTVLSSFDECFFFELVYFGINQRF